jgi:YesN/AraC family two-component response regulator
MTRILVVDDEADILISVKAYIEGALGIEVATAPSGLEGLAVLRSQPIDLVISDFLMPGMTGLQFLTAAMELKPEVPRVMLTAFPDIDLVVRALHQARITLFLTKPVQPAALEDVLQRTLGLAAPEPSGPAPPPPA